MKLGIYNKPVKNTSYPLSHVLVHKASTVSMKQEYYEFLKKKKKYLTIVSVRLFYFSLCFLITYDQLAKFKFSTVFFSCYDCPSHGINTFFFLHLSIIYIIIKIRLNYCTVVK